MKFVTIFFLIAVAAVSAESSGKKCTIDSDCKPQALLGGRYYCDYGQFSCYLVQITSPQPTDKSCNVNRDCYQRLLGVRFNCDPSTKKCYSRQVLPPQPTDRYCESREDCYRLPVGVEYYCDTTTETCATRPLV